MLLLLDARHDSDVVRPLLTHLAVQLEISGYVIGY
jgi:D-methionine transport system ATP-binding protein